MMCCAMAVAARVTAAHSWWRIRVFFLSTTLPSGNQCSMVDGHLSRLPLLGHKWALSTRQQCCPWNQRVAERTLTCQARRKGRRRVNTDGDDVWAEQGDSSQRNEELLSFSADLRNLKCVLQLTQQPGEAEFDAVNSEDASEDVLDGDLEEDLLERAFLVGLQLKNDLQQKRYGYSINESLEELGSLAKTAGLKVVGTTYQSLEHQSPATYIGRGKVKEVSGAAQVLEAETVIFDEELSPVQLMNLEKAVGEDVRVCDRTALTLDIFSQRALTKEGRLQVDLAQLEYQLPRLTRMWTHLERQVAGSGGDQAVRGMGEKQIEIDKRIIRRKIVSIKKELDEVRGQRKHARERRAENGMPVVALAGYTNAGKSTLLNRLTNSEVLVEDKLFATLDPTTRKLELPSGKVALLSDTVGFIQKLPTQLIAAFRATLEELRYATLLLHVVDISHENAAAQADAVVQVLKDIGVDDIPVLTVWNKVDKCENEDIVHSLCEKHANTVAVSGRTGQGIDDLLQAIESSLEESMMPMTVCIPYSCGELLEEVHRRGVVKSLEYVEGGALVSASVPVQLAGKLSHYMVASQAQGSVLEEFHC